MSIGPFLRREMTTSVRGSRAFKDRLYLVLFVASVVLGSVVLWDWRGWDRDSVGGAQGFGLTLFLVVTTALALLGLVLVGPHVAAAIASERDGKTLDALLASRFASGEIVLGAMASGLFRYANAILAGLPVLALVVFLGGIPWPWVILAGAGLASNALLLAAVGVVTSVGARTTTQALNRALTPYFLWVSLPTLIVLLRPMIWPNAPNGLIAIFVELVEWSPMGLVVNLLGIIPRPGGPLASVGRMVACELILTVVLALWAIVRLRPASRGLHDVEGESTRLARIRAAARRPPRRPDCFDNPVLWYAMYSTQGQTALKRLIGGTIVLVILACVAYVMSLFAKPAFEELLERGYRSSPEAFQMPEFHPFARVLIGKLFPRLATGVAAGQGRLEFNIVLRQFTGLFLVGYLTTLFRLTFESIKAERKRDTWLGLIATPLTGSEILRGKQLGSIWRVRGFSATLILLWTLALATGAVHPLGYLAALTFLVVSSAFFSSYGLMMALLVSDPDRPTKAAPLTWKQLPLAWLGGIVLTVGPLLLAGFSLFTFEDFQAMLEGRRFPEFSANYLDEILGARSVVVLWLVGTGALAAGAVVVDRANRRGFDKAIGRPTRSRTVDVLSGSTTELARL